MAGCTEPSDPTIDPEALLLQAARGNAEALGKLLNLHRERLRRMIAFRLDTHLAAYLDASDIVQDSLADAVRKLPDYARERPLPLYPWLHRLASERLTKARLRYRREQGTIRWADSATRLLVDRLVAGDPSPGGAAVREEQRRRVQAALVRMADPDREILLMRHLEDLSFPEIAAILGIAEGAAKMRHLRALNRIHALLGGDGPGSGR
ncbi:MAG: sigma-70 family RNA polymerase sigma factor [Isosphaeraceae bacterium]